MMSKFSFIILFTILTTFVTFQEVQSNPVFVVEKPQDDGLVDLAAFEVETYGFFEDFGKLLKDKATEYSGVALHAGADLIKKQVKEKGLKKGFDKLKKRIGGSNENVNKLIDQIHGKTSEIFDNLVDEGRDKLVEKINRKKNKDNENNEKNTYVTNNNDDEPQDNIEFMALGN